MVSSVRGFAEYVSEMQAFAPRRLVEIVIAEKVVGTLVLGPGGGPQGAGKADGDLEVVSA